MNRWKKSLYLHEYACSYTNDLKYCSIFKYSCVAATLNFLHILVSGQMFVEKYIQISETSSIYSLNSKCIRQSFI